MPFADDTGRSLHRVYKESSATQAMQFFTTQLSEAQLSKLIDSWIYIRENANDTGAYFYNELFRVAPEYKTLFKTDVSVTAEKLMATITILLTKAHKGSNLLADVQHLAIRHSGYGVQPEHYPIIGNALVTALEYGLKDHWNEELKAIWTTLYNSLSGAMITISNNLQNTQNSNVA